MVRARMPINRRLAALDARDVREEKLSFEFTGTVRQIFSMLDNVIGYQNETFQTPIFR